MSASSGSATVKAGGTATVRVAVGGPGRDSGPVTFDATGLPPHTSDTWRPQRIAGGGGTTVHLTTSPRTRPGAYQVLLRATAGLDSRSVPFTLTVVRPQRSPADLLAHVGLGGIVTVGRIVGWLAGRGGPPGPPAESLRPTRRDDERV